MASKHPEALRREDIYILAGHIVTCIVSYRCGRRQVALYKMYKDSWLIYLGIDGKIMVYS